jgi:hypothetical protein
MLDIDILIKQLQGFELGYVCEKTGLSRYVLNKFIRQEGKGSLIDTYVSIKNFVESRKDLT